MRNGALIARNFRAVVYRATVVEQRRGFIQ